MRTATFRAICGCMLLGSGLSASPPGPEVTDQQLQAWVEQLDDESYARREEASQKLHAAGAAAIEALARGSLSDRPETAWRAGETLKQIAITGDHQALDRVAAALERLGHEGQTGIGQVVAEIRARQKQVRHDRAAAQIRHLGGELVGGLGGAVAEGLAFEFDPAVVPGPLIVEEAFGDLGVVPVGEPAEPPADEVEKLAEPPGARLEAIVDELFADEVPATEEAVAEEAIADEVEAEVVGDLLAVAPVPDAMVFMGEIVDFADIAGGFPVPDDGFAPTAAETLLLGSNWRGGDRGLEVLRDLAEVTSVEIDGARLTDAALEHIRALPKLARVNVQGTNFSTEALRELRRAMPDAMLYCQGDGMLGVHAEPTGDCVLTGVHAGSGAEEAGLREGDHILAVDGQEIRDFSELTIAVYAHQAGDRLKIEFEREGNRQTAEVVLQSRANPRPR